MRSILRAPLCALVSFCLFTGAFRTLAEAAPPARAPSAALAAPPAAAQKGSEKEARLSDALLAKRPKGGEYFGLYLMGKKVGYVFSDLRLDPSSPSRAIAKVELHFRANVGQQVSERHHVETRVYESKPGGKLLSFHFEQKGDGGNQTLQGKVTPQGLSVIRKRPGHETETLALPAPRETIESADQARVALFRKAPVKGFTLDGQDLQTYALESTPGKTEERTLAGVKETVRTVVSVSAKEKVPVEARLTDDGALVELRFSEMMQARAEPKNVAMRLDQVEVFGLTRVVLPRALPDASKAIPGALQLVVTGLPERFRKNSDRQKFEAVPGPGDKVRVTLTAKAPVTRKQRPLKDPESGGSNLQSTLLVEASHPEIKALAKKIVGSEKDAYAAALEVSDWVHDNLEKSYGASADRATDVLRQKKGDCTEHSLLTVALLRAAGIPSRRVDGLVYMMNDDRVPALYWHEWVEAYVGEWTQLDPTFGQPVADASHFGVGQDANADITLLIGQLKVLEVGTPKS